MQEFASGFGCDDLFRLHNARRFCEDSWDDTVQGFSRRRSDVWRVLPSCIEIVQSGDASGDKHVSKICSAFHCEIA